MRISDWSSDVCSSDLGDADEAGDALGAGERCQQHDPSAHGGADEDLRPFGQSIQHRHRVACPITDGGLREADRKSVVAGKSVSVRVELGGRRLIKKKKKITHTYIE